MEGTQLSTQLRPDENYMRIYSRKSEQSTKTVLLQYYDCTKYLLHVQDALGGIKNKMRDRINHESTLMNLYKCKVIL